MARIDQVEDLLDEFDFDKVKKVMDCVKWVYHDTNDSGVSIGELRRMARSLLNSAYEASSDLNYNTSCGGFYVERLMYPGDTVKYLTLKFVVTEWSNPCY